MGEICKIKDLAIGYNTTNPTISNINLSVQKGELISIIGPNGSGKSTLIKTLCGLQKPLSGDIILFEKTIQKYNSKELSHQLSFVLSDKIDSGKLRVNEIISLGKFNNSNWWGTLNNKDKEFICNILEVMNLTHLKERFFYELSDGEKQRVLIAKSLAQDTPLIILDEPTSFLDLPNRIEIFNYLKNIAYNENKSIILSTHELDLALTFSDKVWIIDNKSHILECTPNDSQISNILQESFKLKNFLISDGRIIIKNPIS
jgi:iron complex transport system ATP-binding protein